ncbi:fatty-acid O-methyltransferase Mtf2 [Mycobacterium scrofulaceum]|uniref:SAM-dependent methyltransferase n=1 Tax=Mycobacterium scrofulaceum TaxID=1783 RepID=A0A1X0KI78_MYCSC|nr:class I SAM-dependent methyltransferase [Mycobacterium scrofulaceum]ORB74969.1 SAM-dependent methyltransferase [Mycobacterium scrofulaceum]
MALQGQERDVRRQLLRKVNEKYAQYVHEYIYQRFLYRYLTRRLAANDIVFLNYGYEEDPPMGVPLSPPDEPNRFPIQLYHRTAAQVDLRGKHVLEVGCGHGGGASYLMRTFHPASYTGLDLNSDGIEFCRERHNVAGLEFVQGDAENLPFPDESFDAVINIESSHLYARFPRFLTEVARVLRPNGHFLYADFRLTEGLAAWDAQLADAPMRILSQRVISPEVMRGMEKNSQWWMTVVNALVPSFARRFALTRGYRFVWKTYEDLRDGGLTQYRMYCFAKA